MQVAGGHGLEVLAGDHGATLPRGHDNLGREYEARCVTFSAVDAVLDDGVQKDDGTIHRKLSPAMRAAVLAVTPLAGDVDTTTTDGSDLTDVYGPLDVVQLANGTPGRTGSTIHNFYGTGPKRTSSPRRYRSVVTS
jgi:hypothetical protein